MGDEWITLSNIFDNLRGYQKHLYGCGILAGGRCDCGLLRYQGHMEDIVHRFANECALISKSSGGEASTAAATSSAGNPAMREDMSHQREDTPGFNGEPEPVSARTEQDLLKRAHNLVAFLRSAVMCRESLGAEDKRIITKFLKDSSSLQSSSPSPEILNLLKDCLGSLQMESECDGCTVDPCTQCRIKTVIRKAKEK